MTEVIEGTKPVRGRPKKAITLRIENDLLTTGTARAGFGGAIKVREATAYQRLYMTARRLGLNVTIVRVTNRGRYLEAKVVGD